MAVPARDWKTIVERIHARQCVPFLGAGVNAGGNGYVGLPLGAQVALRLIQDLVETEVASFEELARVEVVADALNEYPQLLRLSLQDLARVAFHLERAVDNPHLMGLVREMLADDEREPSGLLRTIARLPVRLVVTTNYDGLMERALADAGREYVRVVQPIAGFDPNDLVRLDETLADAKARGVLILYKIHGSFVDDLACANEERPDRILITEDDYIEFLTVVANEQRGIPQTIRVEMTTGTLLFLGYGLEDWDFRTLFKGTIERLDRHEIFKSFAVQRNPSPFWVKFWEAEPRKVNIHDMDLHEFGDVLAAKYDAYVAARAESGGDG
jgi:hypothetical protein